MKATDSDFTGKQRYNKHRAPIYLVGDSNEKIADIDFGSKEFIEEVKRAQKHLGIKADGLLGPVTVEAMARDNYTGMCTEKPNRNGLVYGTKHSDFFGRQTLNYFNDARIGEMPSSPRTQQIDTIVLHYDVSFYAATTIEILRDRGLSTHFIIDGDEEATVYQLLNPATDVAWHEERANSRSIGIDLNNPIKPKYLESDTKNRGFERDKVTFQFRGEEYTYLDYFDQQIDALAYLLVDLSKSFDIELNRPNHDTVMGESEFSEFEGVVGHYHLDEQKKDPKPLDLDDLFNRIDQIKKVIESTK